MVVQYSAATIYLGLRVLVSGTATAEGDTLSSIQHSRRRCQSVYILIVDCDPSRQVQRSGAAATSMSRLQVVLLGVVQAR